MISAPAPASFVHVAHIGINADGNIETSEDVDPAWAMMVQDLQGYGISHDILVENLDFVEGFLKGAKLAKSQAESKTDSVKMDLTLDRRMSSLFSPIVVYPFTISHSFFSSRKEGLVSKENTSDQYLATTYNTLVLSFFPVLAFCPRACVSMFQSSMFLWA